MGGKGIHVEGKEERDEIIIFNEGGEKKAPSSSRREEGGGVSWLFKRLRAREKESALSSISP